MKGDMVAVRVLVPVVVVRVWSCGGRNSRCVEVVVVQRDPDAGSRIAGRVL